MWLGDISDFDKLHDRRHNDEVRLIAFDLLAVGADDIRREPLHVRKARLEKLLAKSSDGIQLNPHMEGDIGATMFDHACKMGLEGIVSKHRDRAYRAGRSANWIKIKNPASPAMQRAEDGSW